jgi:Holliday junction DNA helicase RuvA
MIGQLKGIIDRIENDYLIIDVNGVGYVVFCSAKTISQIGAIGSAAKLLIETHVREDQITLFGFVSAEEKRWFKLLQNVQGVGAKVALAILSAFSPSDINNVILAQDKTAFKPVAGIGPKLAARLLTELKDKVGFAESTAILPNDGLKLVENSSAESSHKNDAISALVNLGIARMDAFLLVNKVANQNMKVEEIISAALKEVAK